MTFIDAHCDVLCKLILHPNADFTDKTVLDATLDRLVEGGALLQFFAIYIPMTYGPNRSFSHVLQSIDKFYEEVISCPPMIAVRTKRDLVGLSAGGRIGALLSLEGLDAVPNDPMYIRILFQLGLRVVGLTWNFGNWAADGALEPRNGGITQAGIHAIKECDQLGILMDVSHLSERGFWDLANMMPEKPVIASHSNVFDLCPHPRNLSKDQIDHLIQTGGVIGLSFVPFFVADRKKPNVTDLLRHIDYICMRGGALNLGFGSDFDGFDQPIAGLEHPGKYGTLREALLKRYKEEEVKRFMYQNWFEFIKTHLPEESGESFSS